MLRPRGESSHQIHSDEEETVEGRVWNGNVISANRLDMDLIVSGPERSGSKEDGKDAPKREPLADQDFFNDFPDDFDEDDMQLKNK